MKERSPRGPAPPPSSSLPTIALVTQPREWTSPGLQRAKRVARRAPYVLRPDGPVHPSNQLNAGGVRRYHLDDGARGASERRATGEIHARRAIDGEDLPGRAVGGSLQTDDSAVEDAVQIGADRVGGHAPVTGESVGVFDTGCRGAVRKESLGIEGNLPCASVDTAADSENILAR